MVCVLVKHNIEASLHDRGGLFFCDPPSFPVIFFHDPPFWRAQKTLTRPRGGGGGGGGKKKSAPPPFPPPPPPLLISDKSLRYGENVVFRVPDCNKHLFPWIYFLFIVQISSKRHAVRSPQVTIIPGRRP